MVAAVVVWIRSGENPGACFFDDPACSTALATWALCLITICAFIAAYEAARRAGDSFDVSAEALQISSSALELEMKTLLTISVLDTEVAQEPRPRLTYYVVADASDPHADRYALTKSEPTGGPNERPYVPVVFEFENLGRCAILDLRVKLHIADQKPIEVQVGNIGKERTTRVALAFKMPDIADQSALLPPLFAWREARAGRPLDDVDYTELPQIELFRGVQKTGDAEREIWTATIPQGDGSEPSSELKDSQPGKA